MFNPRPVLSFIGLANRSPIRAAVWKRLYDRPPGERLGALEDETLRQDLCDLPSETQRQVAESTYLFGGPGCEYELSAERRLDRVASRRGESPAATLISLLRETRGKQLFATCGANQVPEAIEEMFEYPGMLVGLGDAGAHVTDICDASMTTYVLAHWARDRGAISVEEAIRRLTAEPAQIFGIRERGRLEAGAYADVNVIDLARLDLELPEFAHDLPAGAGRWTQRARGYAFTIVNGEVAIEDGRHTGRLCGNVLRA
jgi:N-acyl-D-aspartate/D-glutamate deacylase